MSIEGARRLKLFLRWAPVIYGRYWKTNIAKHLGYSRRSITYWISGEGVPSTEVLILLELMGFHGYRYDREKNECTTSKYRNGIRL